MLNQPHSRFRTDPRPTVAGAGFKVIAAHQPPAARPSESGYPALSPLLPEAPIFGAIEAGGTKFVCAVGSGPQDLECRVVPTTTPEATLDAVIPFFRARSGLAAIGIGSFGPIDLHPGSPAYGHIPATPKRAWRNFDLAGAVRRALQLPAGFDTDVNAAALGEARWGAGQGIGDFLYITVGTGIGGGALVNGRPLHGLQHPEMGHIRVPHDWAADPFPGV